jgi:hypothetical protein
MKYEYVHFVRIISYEELNPETEKTHTSQKERLRENVKKWARNCAV